MANSITNTQLTQEYIRMSNGLTAVFFETLCLTGASMATQKHEKDLLIWFGQRDYTIIGMGTEGFDIQEIIWDESIFEEQKLFLIQLIEAVKLKTNWHLLDYSPNEQFLFPILDDFCEMINSFTKNHIITQKQIEIFDFDEKIKQYEQCSTHTIYMHFGGCMMCNKN